MFFRLLLFRFIR